MGVMEIFGGRGTDSTRFEHASDEAQKRPVPVRNLLENASSGFTTAKITTGWLMGWGEEGGARGFGVGGEGDERKRQRILDLSDFGAVYRPTIAGKNERKEKSKGTGRVDPHLVREKSK